jgi:hypothetical protein
MNLALTVTPQRRQNSCGQAVSETVHFWRAGPKPSVNVDQTVTHHLGVLEPPADGVVMVDQGPTRAPYEAYAVVRVGDAVRQVAVLDGPAEIRDQTAPTSGWAILGFDAPPRTAAIETTTASGSSQFFLADSASPCHTSPGSRVSPTCQSGQYQVAVQTTPGAGSLAVVANVTSTHGPCVLRQPATGQFRYATGQPDGPAASVDVAWILPLTILWAAGSDCFQRTETLTVTVGDLTVHQTEPGGDCSMAPAGTAGSISHRLGQPGISGQ